MRDLVAPASPADAIVLHIGVPKTGTTALQAALSDARPELEAQRVRYPGTAKHHHREALSAMQRSWGWRQRGGGRTYAPGTWKRVASAARRSGDRTIISSEFLCEATAETAGRIVGDLGPDRARVVVTLRSLGRLLGSSWQQYLKYGITVPYERWLREVLRTTTPHRPTPTFWKRHDHASVLERWGGAVGFDHVTVVVLEDVERSAMYAAFESMLGLRPETLSSRMDLDTNRSMSAAESAFVLGLNRRFSDIVEWDDYNRLIRRGAVLSMVEGRRPGADEAMLLTPQWALDRAAEIASESVARIRRMQERGLVVVGDLDLLAAPIAASPDAVRGRDRLVPIDAAVEAVTGVAGAWKEEPATRELVRMLRERVRRRVRGGRAAPREPEDETGT